MARDKSPGTSGFQINLYVIFWLQIKQPLYDAIMYTSNTGSFSSNMCQGLISLIPKKIEILIMSKTGDQLFY